MYNGNHKWKKIIAIAAAVGAVVVGFIVAWKLGWLAKAKAALTGAKKPASPVVVPPAESGTASGDATIEAS
jgi:hypothetical protein